MLIQGNSGNIADVDDDNKALTRAVTESELQAASKKGDAYSWYAATVDIDAGDTFLFVKNTGNRVLVLDRLLLSGSNVICNWFIHLGSATTTPTGTAVTGRALNRAYSDDTESVAFNDETAVADGDLVKDVWTPVTNTVKVDMDGFRLPSGHYIQINQETESTSGSVTLIGHYEDA